jgi:branched-chain amino acid transport system permease protein
MLAGLGHRYGILIVLAAVMALLPLTFPSGYYFRVASLVWVSAFAAIGLNILMGKAGQVSLGHAGFFGIGAYAVAIGPAHLGLPSLAALVIGAGVSALLAYLVGRPILRLRGHYLAIATLGFGILVALVITTESRWTGGPDGMAAKLSLSAGASADRAPGTGSRADCCLPAHGSPSISTRRRPAAHFARCTTARLRPE